MVSDLAGLVDALKQDQQIKRSERKEDEIMGWMRDNWSYFAPSKRQFQLAFSQLGDVFPYTADGLCAALSVPDEVKLIKMKYADGLLPMVDFEASGYEKDFLALFNSTQSGQAALILVSGKRSLVVTNMNIVWNTGITVAQYLTKEQTEEVGILSIFSAKYAARMLPGIFDNKEKYA